MEEINLEKYKSAWKTEQSFLEEKLPREQIMKFMQMSSKNISGLFKKSLIIDIIIKILLSLSFGVLLVLYSNQNRILLINLVFILLTIFAILAQIKTYKRILGVKNADQNIKTSLYSYIDFYTKKFLLSLIITSFSSPLVFISGAFYYFYYKYGTVRSFQHEDYLVFGAIIFIGFLISAFFQIKNFNFHVRQLESSLADIEQETINESKLKHYKKLNNRNLIIYSIILFIGLLLLILFLFMI
ncbi:hypothetical protein V8G56_07785 [Gaetbulibacter aquiaggeris]|uniref:Uncharacterized protein n=1 Tax=Gaetbulibacter aquiaggeris TaxID=1735373 RepID=A0ABW7MPU5_9FLAO